MVSVFLCSYTNAILGFEPYIGPTGETKGGWSSELFSSAHKCCGLLPQSRGLPQRSQGLYLAALFFYLIFIIFSSFSTYICCLFQPENLILDANGILKVSDFGLSAFSLQVRVNHLIYQLDSMANWKLICEMNNISLCFFISTILLNAGRWFASHCLWNAELCCSWGRYLKFQHLKI